MEWGFYVRLLYIFINKKKISDLFFPAFSVRKNPVFYQKNQDPLQKIKIRKHKKIDVNLKKLF